MKKLVFFSVLLLVGVTATVSAQDLNTNALFPWELNFMSDASEPSFINGYTKFPGFVKFGLGVLNLFFGLGSYVAGEWRDGLMLTTAHGLSVTCVVGAYLFYQTIFTGTAIDFLLIFTGIGLIPVILVVAGVVTYATYAIVGFVLPYREINSRKHSHREHIRREQEQNRRQNKTSNMGYISLKDENVAGQLTFTLSY